MIISFISKELRDNAINEFLALENFSPTTSQMLKTILTSLHAAPSLEDLPSIIKNNFNYTKENIDLVGVANLELQFKIAHLKLPKINSDTIDWNKVYRLQLIHAGEKNVS